MSLYAPTFIIEKILLIFIYIIIKLTYWPTATIDSWSKRQHSCNILVLKLDNNLVYFYISFQNILFI